MIEHDTENRPAAITEVRGVRQRDFQFRNGFRFDLFGLEGRKLSLKNACDGGVLLHNRGAQLRLDVRQYVVD
jgi:uncharacterized UPF0160 family protein